MSSGALNAQETAPLCSLLFSFQFRGFVRCLEAVCLRVNEACFSIASVLRSAPTVPRAPAEHPHGAVFCLPCTSHADVGDGLRVPGLTLQTCWEICSFSSRYMWSFSFTSYRRDRRGFFSSYLDPRPCFRALLPCETLSQGLYFLCKV